MRIASKFAKILLEHEKIILHNFIVDFWKFRIGWFDVVYATVEKDAKKFIHKKLKEAKINLSIHTSITLIYGILGNGFEYGIKF